MTTPAHLYDLAHASVRDDLAAYVTAAHAAKGSVLELMAGTGRVTLPMARTGRPVTALDHDATKLARLKRRLVLEPELDVITHHGDTSEPAPGAPFDLTVWPLFGLALLPSGLDVRATLEQASWQARADGVLLLETYVASEQLQALDGASDHIHVVDPDTGVAWRHDQSVRIHDRGRRLITTDVWTPAGGAPLTLERVQHAHPRDTLVRWLERSGWTLRHESHSAAGGPWAAGDWTWFGVLTKRA